MTLKASIFPIWVVLVLLMVTSCKSVIPVTGNVPSPTEEKVFAELGKHRLSLEYFNAKAKVQYRDGKGSYQFSVLMRMEMGNKIWFQANILGFEIARILIKSDSVYYLNRMEKTCYQSTLKKIGSMENIALDFPTIQNLILGNPLFLNPHELIVSYDKHHIRFTQENGLGQIIHLIDPTEFTLSHLQIRDPSKNHALNAHFKDYKPIGSTRLFSYFREYITKNHNTYLANIQVSFTNIDISEAKNMPFDIPDDYTISPL